MFVATSGAAHRRRDLWKFRICMIIQNETRTHTRMHTHTYQSTIHVHFQIRVLAMSLFYVQHRLYVHLCLVGQWQPGHNFWHQSSYIQTTALRPSSPSIAGNRKVCDRLKTGRGTLYMPTPDSTGALAGVHYGDVMMGAIAPQITSLNIVYSNVYSNGDQRKHQSSASLAFVWGIHRDRWTPRTNGQ